MYAEAATTEELLARLGRRLEAAGVAASGRAPRALAAALDSGARRVTAELARFAPAALEAVVTRTVAQGAASVALPNGGPPTEGAPAEARVVRLLEVAFQIETGAAPVPLEVVDGRASLAMPYLSERGSWALARSGLTLRFLAQGGAPAAGTLTLRYLAGLAALDPNAASATPYAALAPEWTDLIVDFAQLDLLPPDTRLELEASLQPWLEAQAAAERRLATVGPQYIANLE